MGRSSALTAGDLAQLPGRCSGCLRWERFVEGPGTRLGAPGEDPAAEDTAAEDLAAAKRRWWTETLSAGTGGGIVLRVATGAGGAPTVAGYATYAIPGRAGQGTDEQGPGGRGPHGEGPDGPGPDWAGGHALRVLGLHVDAGCRGMGLGRVLVQAVAREALRRPRIRAVEALAGPRDGTLSPVSRCLVPLDFWLACGFTISRQHPVTPTVRLDARVLATWRTEVEEAAAQAWERVRGAVRPEPAPRPALFGEQRVRNRAS